MKCGCQWSVLPHVFLVEEMEKTWLVCSFSRKKHRFDEGGREESDDWQCLNQLEWNFTRDVAKLIVTALIPMCGANLIDVHAIGTMIIQAHN